MGKDRSGQGPEVGFQREVTTASDKETVADTEMDGVAEMPRRLIFGRRRGRKLTPLSAERMDALLPRLELPRADSPVQFGKPVVATWLEIGFGVGDHLLAQAEAHPAVGIIGVEPFLNGVAKLVGVVADKAEAGDEDLAHRIRLFTDDARLLLKALPTASIERAFVLFPDPWPKKRHQWRRIVNPDTLADLARVIRPGGELRLGTDVPDYGRAMLLHALAEPRFRWLAECAADWRHRPADWPSSKYERKAVAAGRACLYFRFQRL